MHFLSCDYHKEEEISLVNCWTVSTYLRTSSENLAQQTLLGLLSYWNT